MKPYYQKKGLRKLKPGPVKLALHNASNPEFAEKFTHPRRQRVHASVDPNPFARLLLKWRNGHGWYRKEAAAKMGVPVDTYTGWEVGKHMPTSAGRSVIKATLNAYPNGPESKP